MYMLKYFLSVYSLLLSFGVFAVECPIDVSLVEVGKGEVEIGLKNKMKQPYEIQYDQLPWVLLGKGVEFQVFVDGKRVPFASGTGRNTLVIKIGPGSYISSVVDIGYLRSFYEGVGNSRVTVRWLYVVPGDEIHEKCRNIKGSVTAP